MFGELGNAIKLQNFVEFLRTHRALPRGMTCGVYGSSSESPHSSPQRGEMVILTQEREMRIEDMRHEHVVEEADIAAFCSLTTRRPPERILLACAVITGDPGTTKTSFISTVTSASAKMLQVLPTHTASFCNVWVDPSPEDVSYFTNEMMTSSSRRSMAYFPSQLCVGSLQCSPSDLVFFMEDEEVGNAESYKWAAEQQHGAQHGLVQITEVGGDMLDRLLSVRRDGSSFLPPPSSPEADLFAVTQLRCAAAAGAVSYFVDLERLLCITRSEHEADERMGRFATTHVVRTIQRLTFIADLTRGAPVMFMVCLVDARSSSPLIGVEDAADLCAEFTILLRRAFEVRDGTVTILVDMMLLSHRRNAVEMSPTPLPDASIRFLQRLLRLCSRIQEGEGEPIRALVNFKLEQLWRLSCQHRHEHDKGTVDELQRSDLVALVAESMRCGHSCGADDDAVTAPRSVQELFARLVSLPPMFLVDFIVRHPMGPVGQS